MKNLLYVKYLFLLMVLIWALIGCSNNPKTTEQYIPIGTYAMQESEEPVKPVVSLEDSNKFTFSYSVLSSYIAIGSYEVDDDNLILRTDDGEYKYVFKIKDDILIFDEKESSKIPSFANVSDGAIFVKSSYPNLTGFLADEDVISIDKTNNVDQTGNVEIDRQLFKSLDDRIIDENNTRFFKIL